MSENLRLDHVSLGSKELDVTVKWLESVAGLRATESWNFMSGLGNRIAYSGAAAVELLGIAFPGMEMISPLAGQVYGRTIGGDRWLTWALMSDDIDATAARLGLDVIDGSAFSTATGEAITWRMCGHIEAFFSEPYLPFFLSYVDEGWRKRAIQTVPAFDVSRIKLSGDPGRLREWLGHAELPVEVTAGPPELRSVVITTDEREVELLPDCA